ncbi:MAG: hypothetical protein DWQ34_02510, partial [Planctomycetota bacterium]
MHDELDFDPDELAVGGGPSHSAALPVWSVRVLAVLGLIIGVYLTSVSFSQSGLPLGCGSGSGCDEVLRSRWSNLFGVPVGAPAVLVYLAIIVCSVLVTRPAGSAARRCGRFGLIALATLVALSAVWFIGLQLLVLRATCPWCMAEHAVGLLTAAASFWLAMTQSANVPVHEPDAAQPRGFGMPVLAGGLIAAAFILLQVSFSTSTTTVARLPAGENSDTGPGPDRWVSVLNGELQLDVHELPTLGSPDAPLLLVLLYDYCCPHCRATHGYLQDGLDRYPDQYGVVLLPMPLDAECNPHVVETEPRFEEACEL